MLKRLNAIYNFLPDQFCTILNSYKSRADDHHNYHNHIHKHYWNDQLKLFSHHSPVEDSVLNPKGDLPERLYCYNAKYNNQKSISHKDEISIFILLLIQFKGNKN